jgi:CheY-like chemotaxis protein
LSKYIVFSIDDERAIRDAFELALEDYESIELHFEENGLKGVELATLFKPDLIFIDLKMPVMSGDIAIEKIREFHSDVPIYVVTAYAKEYFESLDSLKEKNIHFELASKPMSFKQIQMIAESVLDIH